LRTSSTSRFDRLFLVDGQGQVSRSADAGKTFDATGGIGAQPSALTSNGDELLAALGDGKVVRSWKDPVRRSTDCESRVVVVPGTVWGLSDGSPVAEASPEGEP